MVKIGKSEIAVENLYKDYDVKSYKSGFLPSFIKFKTVSDNGKDVMHLQFSGGKLDAIKVYDDRYITAQGIKIGNTAQEAIDKGVHISFINFGEREGLKCSLVEKNPITGKYKPLSNLQFFFSRRIYQNGASRNIGKNAKLKFFVIGDYFDIKMDTLTDEEKKTLRNHKRGEYASNQYVNKYYGIRMNVPTDWTYIDNYGTTEDFVNLLVLKNSRGVARLSLDLQERSAARDGKQFLDRLGLQGKIEQIESYTNGNLYRKLVISKNDIEHEVYYSIVTNGNSLLFKGKWMDQTELVEIENIVMSLDTKVR